MNGNTYQLVLTYVYQYLNKWVPIFDYSVISLKAVLTNNMLIIQTENCVGIGYISIVF